MEKIHGTSAHISWKPEGEQVIFFSGGEKHSKFVNIFDESDLRNRFKQHFPDVEVTIFGEAYGGKQQGMKATYGDSLRFIAFDVKIGDTWLNVPNAEDVTVEKMGLEFVAYEKTSTDLESLNYHRDLPSRQAKRNGILEDKKAEGVVLRPLEEMKKSNGSRVIVKHKRDEFMETKTPRSVDEKELKILAEAKEIANEWVTPMRLTHVLDKLGNPSDVRQTGKVIEAMREDIIREAEGEIVESPKALAEIGKATALLYKQRISKIEK